MPDSCSALSPFCDHAYESFPFIFSSHINEDKRKTEGQVQMFEILRDVDGCPVRMSACLRGENSSFHP